MICYFVKVVLFFTLISCSKQNSTNNDYEKVPRDNEEDFTSVERSFKEDDSIEITLSYAARSCSCPQWFESKHQEINYLEGVELFYVQPFSKEILNINDIWDGKSLPFTVKLVGYFQAEKSIPEQANKNKGYEAAITFIYSDFQVLKGASVELELEDGGSRLDLVLGVK